MLAGKPFTVTAERMPFGIVLVPMAVDASLSIDSFRDRSEHRYGICTAIFA